jgi:glycosyltransferase involved in cell wall biosynthesis
MFPTISVVIPCFKPFFLDRALSSLAEQTDQQFEVVVADDGSPHDLAKICQTYAEKIALRYVRFDENLGGASICQHWNRAVKLATHDWIWLIGDDDELQRECIATMRLAIGKNPDWKGLWRVNVNRIDSNSHVIDYAIPWAEHTAALDYLKLRLQDEVHSYACEYVFRKEKLAKIGGFIDFPLAWCSDDATWLSLATSDGITTIDAENSRAQWRLSDKNISGGGSKLLALKLEARLQYLDWLNLQHKRGLLPIEAKDRKALTALKLNWIMNAIHTTRTKLGIYGALITATRLRRSLDVPFWRIFRQLLRIRRWIDSYSSLGRV